MSHHANPTLRLRPSRAADLACRAAAAGVILLAGCSALQIDVDVYKGPLVSEDGVQQQQLVAMAMSAKTLLYTMRNLLLDVACAGWSNNIEGKRDVVIPTASWESVLGSGGTQTAVKPKFCPSDVARGRISDFTRARRLDDILSAYTNREGCAPPGKVGKKAAANPSPDAKAPDRPFDSGRIACGIDTLANDYAEARDNLATAKSDSDAELQSLKSASEQGLERLMHALVDLGGRMQFLATNLWLIDSESVAQGNEGPANSASDSPGLSSAIKNKALLESIANNIIVHADDLRRQALHRDQQREAAGAEALGADAGFALDAAAHLRSIEVALAAARATATAAEKSSDADKPDGTVGKAKAALDTAQKVARDAQDAHNGALAREAGMAWLALTIGAGNPPSGVPAVPTDKPESWRTDQAAVKKKLGEAGGDKVDVEQVRADLGQWLSDERAPYSSPARAAHPRALRLAAAADAMATLVPAVLPKPNPVARPAAWKELVGRVREALEIAHQSSVELGQALQAKQKAVLRQAGQVVTATKQAEAALRADARRPSADYAAAQTALDELKGKLLTDLRGAGATPSLPTVLSRLRSAAQTAAKDPATPAEAAARYNKAAEVLPEVVVSPQLAVGAATQRNIDVLDGVIAQLRYRHIDLIRSKGKDEPETLRAQASLEAALNQRKDMVYLRPTASYLRSVYAATVTQVDSAATQWQNMLGERSLAVRAYRQVRGDKDLDSARAELDKAYWQNINSVKVGAAGSSNFVIAKDDVGNWYIKAMGSDPSAMVKAAKNLALYNVGAGLNTDLLRVNDLRARIDNEDNKDRRDEMRTELDGLTGSASGPTVAERSRTLSLFRKNYADLSQSQLDGLKTRLGNQVFGRAIEQRWRTSLVDANADARDALFKVFEQPDLRKPYDAAVDALRTEAAATASPVGMKMVDALRQLQAWRAALKAAVAKADGLTLAEQTQAAEATKRVDDDQRNLALLVAKREQMAASLALAEQDRNAMPKKQLSDTQVERINATWETARQNYAEAVRQVVTAESLLADDRGKFNAAQKLVVAAKARQATAINDVDAVLEPAIKDLVAQRLQVVRDTEAAVKIVGGSGS